MFDGVTDISISCIVPVLRNKGRIRRNPRAIRRKRWRFFSSRRLLQLKNLLYHQTRQDRSATHLLQSYPLSSQLHFFSPIIVTCQYHFQNQEFTCIISLVFFPSCLFTFFYCKLDFDSCVSIASSVSLYLKWNGHRSL